PPVIYPLSLHAALPIYLVGVRSGSHVDDRVVAVAVQFRVVPAAAQVVAEVLVGGGAHPRRPVLSVGVLDQVDGDLLPVGLVVVRSEEHTSELQSRENLV